MEIIAKIHQTNIIKHTSITDMILSFDGYLVDLTENSISFSHNTRIIFNSDLIFKEEDSSTKTYIGSLQDNSKFRLVRPKDLEIHKFKSGIKSNSAFTMASINPDGYAIHFLLVSRKEEKDIIIVDKGVTDQVQRLIDASIMALQFGLHTNFIEYSKRILILITHSNELYQYNNGKEFVKVLRQNSNLFTLSEMKKIMESANN